MGSTTLNGETYKTPDTAHVPLRVVVFERATDGSPDYRIFHGRRVSESSKGTVLYQRTTERGEDVGLKTEYVEADDVLSEEPIY